MPRIVPNLWFDTQAEEAAAFYCSVFPNSRIGRILRFSEAGPGPAGSVVTVDFTLDGQPMTAINGGPQFRFTEAVSLMIQCDGQDAVDRYWSALSEGGEEGPCGWLKDRYGLSWQVVPRELLDMYSDETAPGAGRAMQAMLTMRKLDLAELRRAYDGA